MRSALRAHLVWLILLTACARAPVTTPWPQSAGVHGRTPDEALAGQSIAPKPGAARETATPATAASPPPAPPADVRFDEIELD